MVIAVEYEEGRRISQRCTCECGGALSLAWGGTSGIDGYILVCGKDRSHDKLARPYETHLGNSPDVPGWRLSRRRKQEMAKEVGQATANKLMKYEGRAVLTKDDATDIITTLWPKAPELEVKKAMLICVQYGLNPLMKHLHLIPFKNRQTNEITWSIALGIQTTRLLSRRRGPFGYYDDSPRIMTEEEQKKIRGKVDPNNIWAITRVKDQYGNTAQGIGSWPKDKLAKGEDKGNSKENMAMIRSERQALDRLRPGELPQNLEVLDERYAQMEDGRKVDTTTGEIEGDYTVVEEGTEELEDITGDNVSQPPQTGQNQASQDTGADNVATKPTENITKNIPKTDPPTLKKTDPSLFKSWEDLVKAAGTLGVTPQDVFKIANVKGWQDFRDYREAWNSVEQILTDRRAEKAQEELFK